MNLSDYVPTTDTVEITITVPDPNEINYGEPMKNDDGTDMTITMYLPHSKKYKEVRHEQTNRRLIKASQKRGKNQITAEEIEKETVELLVKTTASWNITWDKEQPGFSEDLAWEIYERAPFLQEQLYAGVENAEVFTKT